MYISVSLRLTTLKILILRPIIQDAVSSFSQQAWNGGRFSTFILVRDFLFLFSNYLIAHKAKLLTR